MGERLRALLIETPGTIGLRDVDPLEPGPGEVVARPVHVGICGTDLELLAGVVDPAYVRYPLVPGHEWSGVVEAAGARRGRGSGWRWSATARSRCSRCTSCACSPLPN